ncbi:MAG: SDR family oxidoreductase [Bdellovibrionales bacterium]|nr:SDR family oxidoreductase [Bdellovibrionales bacterium]
MTTSFSGKKALVCGASQGIGWSTAQILADQGAQVTLLARTEERLKTLVNELNGSGHSYLAVDLHDTEALTKALQNQSNDFDILILNAGGPKGGSLLEAKDEEYLESFRTHILANATLVKSIAPHMKSKNYGRIVHIISTSVKAVIPNLGVSNTIRGAVANWSKTLSMELAPFGITVNNVLPGYTKTPRLEKLITATASRLGQSESEVSQMWKDKVPSLRFAEPEEVAHAVVFLASEVAGYINGVNLPVDGGRTPSL